MLVPLHPVEGSRGSARRGQLCQQLAHHAVERRLQSRSLRQRTGEGLPGGTLPGERAGRGREQQHGERELAVEGRIGDGVVHRAGAVAHRTSGVVIVAVGVVFALGEYGEVVSRVVTAVVT